MVYKNSKWRLNVRCARHFHVRKIINFDLVPTAPARPKHGLTPPALDDANHVARCLAQLRSKDKNIEKYIYLSALKEQDPHMFYKLCLEHMSEFTPLIYTPTVGDACLQFSHIYRRPEGLVCISSFVMLQLVIPACCSSFRSKIKGKFEVVRVFQVHISNH